MAPGSAPVSRRAAWLLISAARAAALAALIPLAKSAIDDVGELGMGALIGAAMTESWYCAALAQRTATLLSTGPRNGELLGPDCLVAGLEPAWHFVLLSSKV